MPTAQRLFGHESISIPTLPDKEQEWIRYIKITQLYVRHLYHKIRLDQASDVVGESEGGVRTFVRRVFDTVF